MKGLLLIIPLLLLSACSAPRYAWQHDRGLGLAELQQDHAVCRFFAENLVLPDNYESFPFRSDGVYGGYPFYGSRQPIESSRHPAYWHRKFHRQGFRTFAYPFDMTMACLNGKGWNRVMIDPGQMLAVRQIFVPDSFSIEDAEILRKDSPL